jgi:hypothetical protein
MIQPSIHTRLDGAYQTPLTARPAGRTPHGREAVGMSVGIPNRQANRPQEPEDDLDRLMDSLDALEL